MTLETFLLGATALLATPGPTNTLLATSGAGRGVLRSLPLLAGEIGGYVLAILILREGVGPAIAAVPAFETALRLAVSGYLLYLALRLWRFGATAEAGGGPIGVRRVFVTTLLNPKAIIFAFTLIPAEADGLALLPWMGSLAALILCAGGLWILAGSAMARGLSGRVSGRIGYRFSALVLALLAGMVSAHAFTLG
ncbi:LysE family transporter [Microvirga tunisiensis]|uniref:LysE family transporter n=2 Tax=Pannonibacter tanglangensis TaxID=2750084 RepID=A0A7X5J777_9HYPH|nr:MULTISPECIES: LysE family transporter [unclassified Pannonibacter]NBN63797.1 LysE family transporter [Pannonibacter sp. XCT-34]NBN77444.1 LysE family transporter [Pannonibacter sp. XCT-53]